MPAKTNPVSTPEFKELLHFEELIKLREENPKAFAVLSPSLKITLGHYIAQKRAAENRKAKD